MLSQADTTLSYIANWLCAVRISEAVGGHSFARATIETLAGLAEHGGRLYLDLSERAWRALEIDAEGWRVVGRPAAKFRRTRGSQSLPEPERGGSLEELRPFLNVDGHGWTLIRAFLVAALRPSLPCPILVAKGEGASRLPAA
jgi:hypothetical protein